MAHLARLLVLVGLWLTLVPATAQAPSVGVVTIEGPIGPATASYVQRALADADAAGHRAVILEIDTPGGLVTAMRDIVTAILNAPMPVIGYVAPQGAQAASAGAYILMATHVAAMAPATNVGAATPVTMGGSNPLPTAPGEEPTAPGEEPADGEAEPADDQGEPADAGRAKAINDAAAYFRSLAELRGRNADWAEEAVREASSLAANDALERDVIDLLAGSRAELLEAVDGRTVKLEDGREVTLATAGATVVEIATNWQEELLGVLANPNVAYILMLVGIYGIIFELANPGTIGSGVIGAIALLLGLFALNLLPINYAGVGLILLGVALMVGEALTPSVGILGIGGAIAFVLGSVLLIDTDAPGFTLSPFVIGGVTAVTAGLSIGVLAMAVNAQRGRVVSGVEGLVGQRGRVTEWADGHGRIHVAGETWWAEGPAELEPGQRAEVRRVEGLTLTVAPAADSEETRS